MARVMEIAGTELVVDAPVTLEMTVANAREAARVADKGEVARLTADIAGLVGFELSVERITAWVVETAA